MGNSVDEIDDSDKISGASPNKAEARKKRLAEQLRENLHRRKAQIRARRNLDKPQGE